MKGHLLMWIRGTFQRGRMSRMLRCLGTIAHEVLGTSHPWGCEEWMLRPLRFVGSCRYEPYVAEQKCGMECCCGR